MTPARLTAILVSVLAIVWGTAAILLATTDQTKDSGKLDLPVQVQKNVRLGWKCYIAYDVRKNGSAVYSWFCDPPEEVK